MQNFKNTIEHFQIYLYLSALLCAIIVGLIFPTSASHLEPFIGICIAVLMFSMFAQIPFLNLSKNFLNIKFTLALILSNFLFIPLLVFGLIHAFNISSSAILIGLCLVLLTPCIDYVIVFTALGKGNAHYLLISTPILFILQMLLLPVYMTLFLNKDIITTIEITPFVRSFVTFIIIPVILAILLQLLSKKSIVMQRTLKTTSWLPELFMALVLFTIVASQINKITNDINIVITVVPIYITFIIIAPIVGYLTGKLFRLDIQLIRTIAFSSSTRNALVVLPLALALPDNWVTIATTVIITQTLIELMGEIIYIKLIPKLIK
ncbi:arsenic resistance protein [Staphylococcus caeli]|uniref:Efflux pump n=1 Tax=Staphylococcus caeli TaxID=2201815 RepID=A0A1D4Q665_9STAP|nr:bile acid:sodium symporter [Staphylococcus caeli]SCT23609.1 efflux pump [Staphylococcus caeli]SCT30694.1 efflux pump [Staphylococcus caeli]